MVNWTSAQVGKFGEAAQSLRLYRRAELFKQGTNQSLIDKLYVDPLPNDATLQKMLLPNTTFLIGRKGTGKSTVFQRSQHAIRGHRDSLSAYIDIKTVFESAEVDVALLQRLEAQASALTVEQSKRLLLYRAFIRAVFKDVQVELRRQLESSISAKLWDGFTGKRQEVIDSIGEILEAAFEADYLDVTGIRAEDIKENARSKDGANAKSSFGAKLNLDGKGPPSLAISGTEEENWATETESGNEHAFAKVLLRAFDISGVMSALASKLGEIGVRKLFIFIDDFSELPREAMTVFVDTILAPLNNWSNELVKFKVAAYPGRVYYGQIDRTKIDEIFLDPSRMYGTGDVTTLEEKTTDFTRRLIENRIKHFCGASAETFFSSASEVYRTLFYASMGNPRNLGHLLHYLQESHIAYGRLITIRAVNDASIRYYEDKIEPFFGSQKFRHESFSERASTYSLKELLESLVSRSRELRNYRENAILRKISGRIPTSHFHVVRELESLLSTLELNFFLTKYTDMKDKDGRSVSLYALNFGLCAKYQIGFGRPEGDREYRYYYAERVFDYSSLLKRFLEKNQEIKCDECDAEYDLETLPSIKMFGMLCPSCKKGTCRVTNLSRRYETVLNEIRPELLLPETELGILETLFVGDDLGASEIAGELDCSYQLVGKRGKIMADRGLVKRQMRDGRRRFALTPLARHDYFENNPDRELAIADAIED